MRNFVAKYDFNRASTHESDKDYKRLSKKDLLDLVCEENGDVNEFGSDLYPTKNEDWGLEDELPLKDPKQWESNKEKAFC